MINKWNRKKLSTFGITLFLAAMVFAPAGVVSAATFCQDGTEVPAKVIVDGDPVAYCQTHNGVAPPGTPAPGGAEADDQVQPIYNLIIRTINFLSAAVGIVVVISIVYGGIQYSTAAADPQKISAAKNRIRNALLAFIAYVFLYSFLQWLIPGGLFQ